MCIFSSGFCILSCDRCPYLIQRRKRKTGEGWKEVEMDRIRELSLRLLCENEGWQFPGSAVRGSAGSQVPNKTANLARLPSGFFPHPPIPEPRHQSNAGTRHDSQLNLTLTIQRGSNGVQGKNEQQMRHLSGTVRQQAWKRVRHGNTSKWIQALRRAHYEPIASIVSWKFVNLGSTSKKCQISNVRPNTWQSKQFSMSEATYTYSINCIKNVMSKQSL